MDVNADSPLVWEFYETLKKLSGYGNDLVRCFCLLHKQVENPIFQYTRNLGIFRAY
jgi:hypothetical protein